MLCIFCKEDSSTSKSVEHIIPESLGNVEHILDKGIVCDKCNNYFARKIEKKVLAYPEFQIDRFHMSIPSKKNKIPFINGIVIGEEGPSNIKLFKSKKEGTSIEFLQRDKIPAKGTLTILAPNYLNQANKGDKVSYDINLSRFIAKMALEGIADRTKHSNELFKGMYDLPLDNLRSFARYGSRTLKWPVYIQSCYPADKIFYDKISKEHYEILHEFEYIQIEQNELYFAVTIFGIEYTINIHHPEINNYITWLKKDNKLKNYKYLFHPDKG